MSTAQANVPPGEATGAIARFMVFSFAAVAVGIWSLGLLLEYFPASPIPFAVLLGGISLVVLLSLAIHRSLKRL